MKTSRSSQYFKEAQQYFPGGVNSPVRAFDAVGGEPLLIEHGEGCRIYDVDGHAYIDFCCSWGPLILGHNHPEVRRKVQQAVEKGLSFGTATIEENKLGKLILDNHRYIDKLRFVNSGTEAVMSALRLARGYTGRDKIIKFAGCYHGHVDSMLVKAGSGLATFGLSDSAGVPKAVAQDTIVLPLNDETAVKQAFEKYGSEIACVLIEPVPANNGLLIQEAGYLQFLRDITHKYDSLLVFDEVITGFRLGFEGAAGHYDIRPDLLTYGKIIGGGMPVGAFGGKAEIMKLVAPEGPVYQAGTLSGNPVTMAAGTAQLKVCLQPDFYETLAARTRNFVEGLNNILQEKGYPLRIIYKASVFWPAFTRRDRISSEDQIETKLLKHFPMFYRKVLEQGVYLGPSPYEVGFVSAAHTEADLRKAQQVFLKAMEHSTHA